MKKIFLGLLLVSVLSSCNNWLDILPANEQLSDEYWRSQSDVEAVVNSGYYYLRAMVEPYLIPWGELRGSCLYDRSGSSLQQFQIKPNQRRYVDWGPLYTIINVSNVVLANAHKVREYDDTYEEEELKAHLTEAYFLRALSYFYLVRNWRDVPLITQPFETDEYSYKVPLSKESEIIAQIKKDITDALASGAAKEFYPTNWETKGRATKWALYALMADVCLWSEDYETANTYCDYLLDDRYANPRRPVFMSTPSHASWFSMFNPGNSNESVFELQWNYQEGQTNSLPSIFDSQKNGGNYILSNRLLLDFNNEYAYTYDDGNGTAEAVRTMYGGYFVDDVASFEVADYGYVWKYCGSQTLTDKRTKTYFDPNFILYRMADVKLMKAEALILRSEDAADWQKAVDLINEIRLRSNLDERYYYDNITEETLLEWVLYERRMELVGEGKAWYDILRFGRRANNKHKQLFLVDKVLAYNDQASESWLTSVLSNDDALFLPIWEEELRNNELLVQNPYYY